MSVFQCKQFSVEQNASVFKLTTDAMLLGALAYKDDVQARTILEIGCGTGIISLMLAQRFSKSEITAIDINAEAVQLSQENFQRSSFADRLSASKCDFTGFASDEKFDLIITNPPYFVDDSPSSNAVQKTARHQSTLSYKLLISKALEMLSDRGVLSLIHPLRYKELILSQIPANYKRKSINIAHRESAKISNVITEISYSDSGENSEEMFYIRDEVGNYSEMYKDAMRDYLLIF